MRQLCYGAYLDRTRLVFGEHTEQDSSEQLLNELGDGVLAPWK